MRCKYNISVFFTVWRKWFWFCFLILFFFYDEWWLWGKVKRERFMIHMESFSVILEGSLSTMSWLRRVVHSDVCKFLLQYFCIGYVNVEDKNDNLSIIDYSISYRIYNINRISKEVNVNRFIFWRYVWMIS